MRDSELTAAPTKRYTIAELMEECEYGPTIAQMLGRPFMSSKMRDHCLSLRDNEGRLLFESEEELLRFSGFVVYDLPRMPRVKS